MKRSKDKALPLISVIVPVYMVERYLSRCVDSILAQTYTNLEVILVDDGSLDSSGKMCDEYAQRDHRIKVLHKENGGLSSARNAGIELAAGVYITFIDSDDWVANDYIVTLYTLLEKYDADMSVAGYIRVKNNTINIFEDKKAHEKLYSKHEYLLKILKYKTQENVQYSWGKLYKNFKNTDLRFPEGLIDEDVPTTFKYVNSIGRIASSTKVVYAYYQNSNSILGKKFNRKRFDLITVWKMICDYSIEECDCDIQEYARINLYRANFGILCNICTEEIEDSDADFIMQHEQEALKVVRLHWKELLKYPMPITRKLMVLVFCIDYENTKKIAQKIHSIKKCMTFQLNQKPGIQKRKDE